MLRQSVWRSAKKKNSLGGESLQGALAEMVGFEPTCPVKDKTISNRSRYDHFDTSPYEKKKKNTLKHYAGKLQDGDF